MHSSLRMTSVDLMNFPDDNKRREIIDGELYVSTQPHWYHQVLCTRLGHFLGEWSDSSGSSQVAIAPGLIFAEDDAVVPEVVWASQERLARILEGGKLYAAPELVIEVLSPGKKNIARDRETKLKLYARRDADEYWIADWPRHAIEIYRRDGWPRRHADDTAFTRLRRRPRSALHGISVRRGRGRERRISRCMSVWRAVETWGLYPASCTTIAPPSTIPPLWAGHAYSIDSLRQQQR